MRRKFMITSATALLGAALLALPASAGPQAGGMDEMSAQAGTKGVGATRSGAGPGTNQGDPGMSSVTGPGANPISTPKPKRQVKKHHRSTVGSSRQ
jgi:hypothetical protein